MPRAEEQVFDELPEHLVLERKNLENFHKSTVEEPYHEFLTTFPLQSSYLTGIETLDAASQRLLHLSELDKKKCWSKVPKTKFSYTALHEIVRSADLKTLQMVVDNHPVDINSQSRSGRTALHYAILMGHDEIVEFLLSRKVDVSIVDKVGSNALHLAVALNRESLAKALLTFGLDFSQKNYAGHRPLEIMALNVLGYKNTNLFKHLIKLIIKRQTGIVEHWLEDLYSCGIFEMSMSPRDLTGSQLLQLQDQNSEAFKEKWKGLQAVMNPDFKSTGRSTLPGQGFRDDRPSSLANGRFLELWSKYYDSLKLGCKPTVICKFSKKTEPDTVHLKYEIRGIRKGRYDPQFIDMGLMVVRLRDDLIFREDVDPDISVEQPEVVKPTSAGGAEKLKKDKKRNGCQSAMKHEASGSEDVGDFVIIEQEIQSVIEIIEIVHQMVSSVEAAKFDGVMDEVKIVEHEIESMIQLIDIICQMTSTVELMTLGTTPIGETSVQAVIGNSSMMINSNKQLHISSVANVNSSDNSIVSKVSDNVVDTIHLEISQKSEMVMQPMPIYRESSYQETEAEERVARFLREGPIVDLRSLPWENESARVYSEKTSTVSGANPTYWDEIVVNAEQPANEISTTSVETTVQNVISNTGVPILNVEKNSSIDGRPA
jgi:hypothetical protein